jgi:hypothetical protein
MADAWYIPWGICVAQNTKEGKAALAKFVGSEFEQDYEKLRITKKGTDFARFTVEGGDGISYRDYPPEGSEFADFLADFKELTFLVSANSSWLSSNEEGYEHFLVKSGKLETGGAYSLPWSDYGEEDEDGDSNEEIAQENCCKARDKEMEENLAEFINGHWDELAWERKNPQFIKYLVENGAWDKAGITKLWKEVDVAAALAADPSLFTAVPDKYKTAEACLAALAEAKSNIDEILSSAPKKLKTPEFFAEAIKKNGLVLGEIPDKQKTKEMCEAAVKQNPAAFEHVPEKFVTEKLAALAVPFDGTALRYVPEAKRSAALCEAALKQKPWAFRYVPDKLKTEALCKAAALGAGDNFEVLSQIPEKFRTAEICKIVIEKFRGDGPTFTYGVCKNIPQSVWSSEMAKAAMEKNSSAFEYVPDKFKTKEMCINAVAEHSDMLEDVPDALKTRDFWEALVKAESDLLEDVPEEFKTKAMCEAAFARWVESPAECRSVFEYIPDKFKTKEMCISAVTKEGLHMAKYIPDALKTLDLCEAVVKEKPRFLEYVPEEFKTKAMCEAAFAERKWMIACIPDSFKTEKMCRAAAEDDTENIQYFPEAMFAPKFLLSIIPKSQEDWKGLQYIPEDKRTREVCLAALKAGSELKFVPEALRDKEICLEAVKAHASLSEVPEEIRDEDICAEAVKNYNGNLEYVPTALQAKVKKAAGIK